jgi:hypothetical protein
MDLNNARKHPIIGGLFSYGLACSMLLGGCYGCFKWLSSQALSPVKLNKGAYTVEVIDIEHSDRPVRIVEVQDAHRTDYRVFGNDYSSPVAGMHAANQDFPYNPDGHVDQIIISVPKGHPLEALANSDSLDRLIREYRLFRFGSGIDLEALSK